MNERMNQDYMISVSSNRGGESRQINKFDITEEDLKWVFDIYAQSHDKITLGGVQLTGPNVVFDERVKNVIKNSLQNGSAIGLNISASTISGGRSSFTETHLQAKPQPHQEPSREKIQVSGADINLTNDRETVTGIKAKTITISGDRCEVKDAEADTITINGDRVNLSNIKAKNIVMNGGRVELSDATIEEELFIRGERCVIRQCSAGETYVNGDKISFEGKNNQVGKLSVSGAKCSGTVEATELLFTEEDSPLLQEMTVVLNVDGQRRVIQNRTSVAVAGSIISGDKVLGRRHQGDKVGGDTYEFGDLVGVSSFAAGKGASASGGKVSHDSSPVAYDRQTNTEVQIKPGDVVFGGDGNNYSGDFTGVTLDPSLKSSAPEGAYLYRPSDETFYDSHGDEVQARTLVKLLFKMKFPGKTNFYP